MQLNLFSPPPIPLFDFTPVHPLPDVFELIERIGTDQDWQTRDLGELLKLWDCLYDEYIASLLEPIKQSQEWFKPNGKYYASARPVQRQFYKRQYERLNDARVLHQSVMDELYAQRMHSVFEETKQTLIKRGLSEQDAQGCYDFFGELFQRPQPTDLPKKNPSAQTGRDGRIPKTGYLLADVYSLSLESERLIKPNATPTLHSEILPKFQRLGYPQADVKFQLETEGKPCIWLIWIAEGEA